MILNEKDFNFISCSSDLKKYFGSGQYKNKMKTTITTFLCAFALILTSAQANTGFQAAMGKALRHFDSAQSTTELVDAANAFKRIAQVEANEWLPLYYHALCYTRISFMSKEDAATKEKER